MENARCGPGAFCGLLLALTLPGCGPAQHGAPTDGQLSGGRYTNSYFGFALTVPPAWSVAPEEVLQQIQRANNQPLTGVGHDRDLKRRIEFAAQDSHQLLLLSKKPWASATNSNPSLIVGAEHLSHLAGVRTGRDYLAHLSRLLSNSTLPYQPSGGLVEVRLAGRTFARLGFIAKIGNQTLRQDYLATVDQGYVLVFILSAGPQADFLRLEQAIQSLRFR
ncbi:MAG TPA: hypothetical protein VEO53_04580 [Candidatus Binatia bacterium]|nr:hypothetical protein [Candidatus Binatia bacterium]